MRGKISEEMEVKASISKAWEVYSSPKVGVIIKAEPGHPYRVEVLEGDGGVGTVVKVTPLPGVSTVTPYKEKYTKIDHEKKMREVEIIEGGYLDLGFKSFKITLELIDKQHEDACTTRLTADYEADEQVANAYCGSAMNSYINVIKVINRNIENNKP